VTKRDIPNVISVFRALLVIPIVVLLQSQQFNMALLLFAIAGISDALDGFLAKRYSWASRLGSVLDPIADKILLVFTFVTLAVMNLVPFWLLFLVIARDVLIVFGAVAYYLFVGRYSMAPRIISKINTVVQISLLLIIISTQALLIWPDYVVQGLIYLTVLTTTLSGLDYMSVWGRKVLSEVGDIKAHD